MHTIHRIMVSALGGLLYGMVAGADPAQSDAWLEALRKERNIPGISASVGVDGRLVWSGAAGKANLELDVDATPATRYRLGSVSKLLTMAAVARMLEAGTLDVDAPIRTYVDYFPEKSRSVTIRHLATHSGGIRHYNQADQELCVKHYFTMAEAIAIFADDPLLFEPGAGYAYSSYGYNLISAAVEGAAGKPFLEVLAEQVFAPLEMTGSGPDNVFEIVPNRSGFYFEYQGQIPGVAIPAGTLLNAPLNDSSYKWASGGLLGTADDLVRFANGHLGAGYLKAETLTLLFRPHPDLDTGRDFQIGLGWRISRGDDGRLRYHHGGAMAGARAYLLILPESRITVAILANMFTDFGLDEALALADLWTGDGVAAAP